MPNLIRGEVPFKAAGRELFLCYGTREIAEAQTALGFRRPDPFQADTVEDVDVAVDQPDGKGGRRPVFDSEGLQIFRKKRVLVDATERQQRMLAAFEACLMNPDPSAVVIFFRSGLGRWERTNKAKLSAEAFEEIVAALGLVAMKTLHFKAITFGAYLKGEEPEEEGEGKVESAVTASST